MTAPSPRRWRETERAVIAWLRTHGHPYAETTRNRERGSGRQSQRGDVDGVPGLVIEAKSHTSGTSWPTWARQATEEACGLPWVVIHRRPGTSDVGRWDCLTSEAWAGFHGGGPATGLLITVADALEEPDFPDALTGNCEDDLDDWSLDLSFTESEPA